MKIDRAWVVLAGVLLASGCAALPRAPRHPMDDRAFAAPILARHAGVPDDRPPALVLLPGDRVTIEMSSSTVSIMPGVLIEGSGTVHLPLAGDVEIAGLGMVAAEGKLKLALQRYDSLMHVSLAVSSLDGHKVTVAGAVKTPGVVLLTPAERLADAIMASGGTITNLVNGQMVDGSDLQSARLVRDGVRLPIDFQQAVSGDPHHNVFLRAGDQIYIPSGRGLTVSIMGETNGQVQQWAPGFRLTQALAMSGGVNQGGDKNDIRIVRGSIDMPRVYTTSLREVIDGEGHDVELYPGDVIYVTDHWIQDFGEIIAIIAPIVSLTFSASALAVALSNSSATTTTTTRPTTTTTTPATGGLMRLNLP
jgi:polysaccharide export outer membrane protein